MGRPKKADFNVRYGRSWQPFLHPSRVVWIILGPRFCGDVTVRRRRDLAGHSGTSSLSRRRRIGSHDVQSAQFLELCIVEVVRVVFPQLLVFILRARSICRFVAG